MGSQKAEKKQTVYKSNTRYEPQIFCNSFDGWMQARRDGDRQQMDRYINEIYEYLKDFIYHTLWKHYPQQMANQEACAELIQNFWLEVMKVLPGYDYRKARITTYLAPYVYSAGRAYYGYLYHTTGYYADVRGVLEKAANGLLLEGEEEPETETLARVTGIPKTTIERVCEGMRVDQQMCSLETSFAEIDSMLPSQEGIPEKVILRQDLREMFGRFQKKLSGEEADVLEAMREMESMGDEGLNCRKIRIYLIEKPGEDAASAGKKYSCFRIRKIKQRIGEKLLWDREMRDYSCAYKQIG